MQSKIGEPTNTIINDDGQLVAWDAIEEEVRCSAPGDTQTKLTIREASEKFKVPYHAIYSRAKRRKWKLVDGNKRENAKRRGETDWPTRGEEHREIAFNLAHESVKLFKPKAPKGFKDLEIADRIARRAAGLDVADVVNQTLVHINESIEAHGDVIEADVVEANSSEPPDQEAATENASVARIEDNGAPLHAGS